MTLVYRLKSGKAGLEFFTWKFLNKSDQFDFDVFDVHKRAQTVEKTVWIKTNSLEVAARQMAQEAADHCRQAATSNAVAVTVGLNRVQMLAHLGCVLR